MVFIGVITDNEDYEYIKKELLKDNQNLSIELININENNVQNMKNIKFETIVIGDEIIKIKKQKICIDNIINNSKYLIINSDNNISNINIEDTTIQIITYGMNQKATVTASSIKEDQILICVQRNIKRINGKIIEMQEFKRKAEKIRNNKVYNLLIVFILEQLYK